jgi:2-dehydro-3-deoxyphosphogluconate aldolase/(4S)-4-hydroxy-2-oxoglutarate aldolase
MNERYQDLGTLLEQAVVVPVVVVERRETALPLARALVAGGLRMLEITLRTPVAFDVIRAIAAEVGEAIVGAGTVLTPAQYQEAERAGARFIVSPGATPGLLDAAGTLAAPLLPGAATASEVMALAERGFRDLKFFPAEPAGGLSYLKALGGPLPQVRFCPTGGIDLARAEAYLNLPNVVCVGGSWMMPVEAVAGGDFARISALAKQAFELHRGSKPNARREAS